MTNRPVIDTETEIEERVTAVTNILSSGDWSSAFTRNKLRRLIMEAQDAVVTRTVDNLKATAERHWSSPEPVPASSLGNGHGLLAGAPVG